MAVANLDPAKLQLVQELEIEMMSDMYNRLVGACHMKIGKKLSNMSQGEDDLTKVNLPDKK
ncbi:Mitochondrial intermembrane space translocase subunit Tim10 [Operophtera brumata]|uniref:Mitochondrial intermembrane space translocase subunit Tim10 n=1 Tax=Operophtera brumata TaxID=104452 RepID=A0A0L7LJ29_OPEBR|nr:Mitochondrial intermembrane space translocase subunit Tim10 [Operophtera brumata]